MNTAQVERFVLRYLESQQCEVLERSPAHVTVKLSPQADRDLTGRAYYWNFVERTGAPAETMTYTFIFDRDSYEQRRAAAGSGHGGGAGAPAGSAAGAAAWGGPAPAPGAGASGGLPGAPGATAAPAAFAPSAAAPGAPAAPPAPAGTAAPAAPDSILGRYFGVSVAPAGLSGRIPSDDVAFGSRRLDQIFAAVRGKGRVVRLFQQPAAAAARSTAYTTWLCINFKVELACDMKRDEMHSFGIRLTTGEIRERFLDELSRLPLTPSIPPNIYLQPAQRPLIQAAQELEAALERKIARYDHRWAEEAHTRLLEELARIDGYYEEYLRSLDGDQKEQAEQQYTARRREAEWQLSPRVSVSVVNCGLFHLHPSALPAGDETS